MPEETGQEETKEELTPEQIKAAAAESETTETEVAEEVKEKTWAQLGMHERYDGMSRQEIATDILHRNTVHGRQTGEVGQLRKDLAAAQEQLAGVKKAADLPVEVKAEVQKMSEAELSRWLEDLQTDPRAAIQSLLGDNFGRRSDDDMNAIIDKRVDEGLQGYHGFTQDEAAKSDVDYPIYADYIEGLQRPEHFGNTRSPRELLDFARLYDADKDAANAVYDAMKRFPRVPIKDCVHMVNGRPKAEVSADKIRQQVNELSGVTKTSGSHKASATPNIKSMDDAFDGDQIDG